MTPYRSHNMPNEKEEIQRKLDTARGKLSVVNAELNRLDGLLNPLREELTVAEKERQYLLARIIKLTNMLPGL